MQKNRKTVTIIILTTFILVIIAAVLILTQTELLPGLSPIFNPSDEKETKPKEKEEQENESENNKKDSQIYKNYEQYKDEYVQFQYPQGAEVEVISGKLNERAAENFVGVESISIEDLLYAGVIYMGGTTIIEYDLNDPNNISLGGHTSSINKYRVSSIWVKQLDNGLYLASFIYQFGDEEKTESFLLEKETDTLFTGTAEYIDKKHVDFLYYTEGTYLDLTAEEYENSEYNPSFMVKCKVNSDDEFNKCYEELNVFFNTAEPIDKKSAKSKTITDEFKYCENASDCIAVDCGCDCSGCGGFPYDEIINKKYEDQWYKEENCQPSDICPQVCCPERSIECRQNECVVIE